MTELFTNIPSEIKKMIIQYIDYIFDNFDLSTSAEFIKEFANSCTVESQKEFIDFYFLLKMEQFKNESNTNFSKEPTWQGYSSSNDEE